MSTHPENPTENRLPGPQPEPGSTPDRILSATHELAVKEGFSGLSLEKVAQRAGVSRLTVYYHFGSKAQLLEALMERMAARGQIHRLEDVFREPDARVALDRFIEVFCHFWATDRVGRRRMRAWQRLHKPVDAERESWRRHGVETLLNRLGKSSPDLVDLLFTLTGFETFDTLAGEARDAGAVAELISRTAHAVLGLSDG